MQGEMWGLLSTSSSVSTYYFPSEFKLIPKLSLQMTVLEKQCHLLSLNVLSVHARNLDIFYRPNYVPSANVS